MSLNYRMLVELALKYGAVGNDPVHNYIRSLLVSQSISPPFSEICGCGKLRHDHTTETEHEFKGLEIDPVEIQMPALDFLGAEKFKQFFNVTSARVQDMTPEQIMDLQEKIQTAQKVLSVVNYAASTKLSSLRSDLTPEYRSALNKREKNFAASHTGQVKREQSAKSGANLISKWETRRAVGIKGLVNMLGLEKEEAEKMWLAQNPKPGV